MNELSYQAPDVKETETFYRRARWWVAHREGLRRFAIGVWIVFDTALLVFAVGVFTDAFLIRYEDERGLIRSLLIDNPTALYETTQARAARPLVVNGDPLVLSGTEGAFDLALDVRNPNKDWWAEVTYGFRYRGDQMTSLQTVVLVPESSQLLVALGVEGARPTGATLEIERLAWHRIDPHDIVDIDAWKQDRLSFVVSEASFTNLGGGSGAPVGRSVFSVTNNTAFSYWSVPLTVALRRGSSLVGVTTTVIEQLEAGETRPLELSWFQPLPTVDAIDVVPQINPFDVSNIMPLAADRGIDTRANFGF